MIEYLKVFIVVCGWLLQQSVQVQLRKCVFRVRVQSRQISLFMWMMNGIRFIVNSIRVQSRMCSLVQCLLWVIGNIGILVLVYLFLWWMQSVQKCGGVQVKMISISNSGLVFRWLVMVIQLSSGGVVLVSLLMMMFCGVVCFRKLVQSVVQLSSEVRVSQVVSGLVKVSSMVILVSVRSSVKFSVMFGDI